MGNLIIFVHSGSNLYFKNNLLNLRKIDPNCKIVHIGDFNFNLKGIIFVDINTLNHSSIEVFSSTYEHMSSNPYEFELFCLKRWIIIDEYLSNTEVNNFFISDSDNLVNYSLSFIHDIVKDSDFAYFVSKDLATGHFSYFTKNAFNQFIKFLKVVYCNNHYKKIMKEKYLYLKKNNIEGGISDMDILYFFYHEVREELKFFNLLDENKGYIFDESINKIHISGIESFKGYYQRYLKQTIKLIFKDANGLNFTFSLKGKKLYLLTTHFQGKAKLLMHRYLIIKINKIIYFLLEIKILFRNLKLGILRLKNAFSGRLPQFGRPPHFSDDLKI